MNLRLSTKKLGDTVERVWCEKCRAPTGLDDLPIPRLTGGDLRIPLRKSKGVGHKGV
jgi:hypothetical protein